MERKIVKAVLSCLLLFPVVFSASGSPARENSPGYFARNHQEISPEAADRLTRSYKEISAEAAENLARRRAIENENGIRRHRVHQDEDEAAEPQDKRAENHSEWSDWSAEDFNKLNFHDFNNVGWLAVNGNDGHQQERNHEHIPDFRTFVIVKVILPMEQAGRRMMEGVVHYVKDFGELVAEARGIIFIFASSYLVLIIIYALVSHCYRKCSSIPPNPNRKYRLENLREVRSKVLQEIKRRRATTSGQDKYKIMHDCDATVINMNEGVSEPKRIKTTNPRL